MDALRAGIGDWGLGFRRCRPEGLRYRIRIAAITLFLFAPLAPLYAQPLPPELTKAVNDFANVIEPASEAELERRIVELKNASGDVVVVATIDTFAPYGDIREYAVKMFANRGRGIGARAKDNGLLVLLAVRDRRVWMEVGYDLEQFITDGLAGEISRNDMAPHFARGDYGQGLLAGVTRVIGRIAQERGVTLSNVPVDTDTRDRGSRITISPWIIFLIIFVIILMNSGGGPRSRMRRRTHWGSPGWSGWNSGVGPFGGGGRIGGGGFGGGFGGFGGGRSGGGGGGAGW
jgi:uncharacterized protein